MLTVTWEGHAIGALSACDPGSGSHARGVLGHAPPERF